MLIVIIASFPLCPYPIKLKYRLPWLTTLYFSRIYVRSPLSPPNNHPSHLTDGSGVTLGQMTRTEVGDAPHWLQASLAQPIALASLTTGLQNNSKSLINNRQIILHSETLKQGSSVNQRRIFQFICITNIINQPSPTRFARRNLQLKIAYTLLSH